MIFESRKGSYFNLIIILLASLLLAKIIFKLTSDNPIRINDIIIYILNGSFLGFFLWLNFDTKYELTETELKYKNGPIKGLIKLDEIKEVEIGKYLLSGNRAATAFGGIVIKYGKYEEIYISPKTNESFIKALIKRNGEIAIK